MTDCSHSINLRGARPGVSVTQLRRRANVHDFTPSPVARGAKLGSRPRARGLVRRDARPFDHSSMSQTASLA